MSGHSSHKRKKGFIVDSHLKPHVIEYMQHAMISAQSRGETPRFDSNECLAFLPPSFQRQKQMPLIKTIGASMYYKYIQNNENPERGFDLFRCGFLSMLLYFSPHRAPFIHGSRVRYFRDRAKSSGQTSQTCTYVWRSNSFLKTNKGLY